MMKDGDLKASQLCVGLGARKKNGINNIHFFGSFFLLTPELSFLVRSLFPPIPLPVLNTYSVLRCCSSRLPQRCMILHSLLLT